MVLFVLASGTVDAETMTLTSDDNGKDGLVSEAIGTVSDGDTLYLTGGMFYEENLVIDKEVSLEGDGDSFLVTTSIHVTADNVSFKMLLITLDPGIMTIVGDNWTLDNVVMQECIGDTCLRTDDTFGGSILNSTIIGVENDALQVYGSSNVTIRDGFFYSPYIGLNFVNSTNITMENIRVSQSFIGTYLSWSGDVEITHSVYDTESYGVLATNSTNVTVDDSIFVSSGQYYGNYGVYLAYSTEVDVLNSTFNSNTGGIAAWNSHDVEVRWNSIFGNLEGIWSIQSDMVLAENALFNNIRYNLNHTGVEISASRNYWGTSSLSEAKTMVNGKVSIGNIMMEDPTPDEAPKLVSKVPAVHTSIEDAASEVVYDMSPHFSDDTWYYTAYMPRPSPIIYEVLSVSDPLNVTLGMGARSTCSGDCFEEEWDLRASTSANWYGEVEVVIRGRDWRGKYVDSNPFTIRFLPVNDRPVMTIEDVPKYSVVKVNTGDNRAFNITVYDDSKTLWLETRLDDGEWKKVEDLGCVPDNSSRMRELPSCAETTYKFKVDEELEVGKHDLRFRVCDGEFCSDEVYTGRYEVTVDNRGLASKGFSPMGAAIALGLLLLGLAVAGATSSRQGREPKEERPRRAVKASEEE
jgi:parallel beta-helix repeat protein